MEVLAQSLPDAVRGFAAGEREVLEIIGLSFRVSTASTLVASLLSVPAGLLLFLGRFPGKSLVLQVVNALMAMPTVVVGLLVYGVLSRQGPLGSLGLLYTPEAIVIGEVIMALPIITALTHAAFEGLDPRVRRTALTLGANLWHSSWVMVREARYALLAAVAAGFARVVSEVGSALMVGGNIRGYTRTMTTAIALETSKGEFAQALLLGVLLLALALSINVFVRSSLKRRS
ncbi:MAG: ABC transporter permease [bacterium]